MRSPCAVASFASMPRFYIAAGGGARQNPRKVPAAPRPPRSGLPHRRLRPAGPARTVLPARLAAVPPAQRQDFLANRPEIGNNQRTGTGPAPRLLCNLRSEPSLMSLIGKLLAILNVLAAVAFVVIAGMDWQQRERWAYTVFRHDLFVDGLPIDDKENGPDLQPRVDEAHGAVARTTFSRAGGGARGQDTIRGGEKPPQGRGGPGRQSRGARDAQPETGRLCPGPRRHADRARKPDAARWPTRRPTTKPPCRSNWTPSSTP